MDNKRKNRRHERVTTKTQRAVLLKYDIKQVECTIDNALSILHSTCSKISLKMALQFGRNM